MSAPAPDTWLTVWLRDGSIVRIVPEEADVIDAAVERLTGEDAPQFAALDAEERDQWLRLRAVNGAPVRLLASFITGHLRSTPESRAVEDALEALLAREKAAHDAADPADADTPSPVAS